MGRSLKESMVCRLHGKDTPKRYRVHDALTKLDKLIWKTANNFHMKVQHLDIDDLYQQGCLGVLTAWEKFDDTRDIAFITYANWWILKFIQTFCSAMEYSLSLNSQNQKIYKELCMGRGLSDSVAATPKNEALAMLAKCNNGFTKKLDKDEFSEDDVNLDKTEASHSVDPIINTILSKLKEKLDAKDYYIVVSSSGLVHDQPLTVIEISERLNLPRDYVKSVKEKHHNAILSAICS